MQTVFYVDSLVLTTILTVIGTGFWSSISSASSLNGMSQGPTFERLERLSQLITLQVCVSDVLTGKSYGYRGAWLIRGDPTVAGPGGRGDALRRAGLALGERLRRIVPQSPARRVDQRRGLRQPGRSQALGRRLATGVLFALPCSPVMTIIWYGPRPLRKSSRKPFIKIQQSSSGRTSGRSRSRLPPGTG